MRRICYFLLLIMACLEGSVPQPVDLPPVIEKIEQSLSFSGEIKQSANGFVYVDISDDYIYKVFPLIASYDSQAALPPYFDRKDAAGAHISFILAKEHAKIPPEWIGKKIDFAVTGLFSVIPDGFSGAEKIYLLEVTAPELETLREQLGLNPKIDGHEFHITVAIVFTTRVQAA